MHYLQDLWNSLNFNSVLDVVLRLVSVFLCLTVHETCHGLAALALGDPTAKQQHRLSLNPLRHIDWLGLGMMVFAGFGWAKPVPVNPSYFKKPKQGMALTALAGPVSNFILAFLLILLARLVLPGALESAWMENLFFFLIETAGLSIGLGLFNLVPIPPLDGSKVLFALLPDKQYAVLMRYEHLGFILLFLLVALDVGSGWINHAIQTVFNFFYQIVFI